MTKIIGSNEKDYEVSKRISYELLVLLLINIFISSELFLIIAFCYLIFLICVRNHGVLIRNTGTNVIYLIIIFIIGVTIGLFNIHEYGIHTIIRDVFYILNPIIFILLGVYFQKTWKAQYDIFKTIIVLAVILSVTNIFTLVSNIEIIKVANSVGLIRSELGYVGIAVVLGLILLLTEKQRKIKYFRKEVRLIFIIICSTALILSFSRTNFVIFTALLIPFILIDTKISNKSIKNIFLTVVLVIGLSGVTYKILPITLLNDFFAKMMRSFAELSTNSDWDSTYNISYNWRGYEISCAIKDFFKGNINDMIFGYGFGKGIFVGPLAYLVMPGAVNGMIPVIHNGYYTLLIKNGIVGLIIYLLFYLTNIKNALKGIINKINLYESKFFLGCLLSSIFVTYFVVGIISKSGYLPMCLLIGYISSNRLIVENKNLVLAKLDKDYNVHK